MSQDSINAARSNLSQACTRMPYSAMLRTPSFDPWQTQDQMPTEDEFLDGVTVWLNDLAGRLREVARIAEQTQEQRDQLLRERAAIRSFFGTTPQSGTT